MRFRYRSFYALFSALVLSASLAFAGQYTAETPTPSIDPAAFSMQAEEISPIQPFLGAAILTPGLLSSAECANFDTNPPLNSNFLFIPPDPICAAGPSHVVDVGNVYIEWRIKGALTDTPQYLAGLDAFFAGTPGMLPSVVPTNMFDPKCTYDQNAGRFVVIVLQRNASPLDSRILVAVSKTSDPNAGWWLHAINSLITISGLPRWADYPGLAADNDALYITNNMFSAAGAFAGSRLWIVDKAATYGGPNGSIVAPVYDAWALSGAVAGYGGLIGTTTMPAAMWGTEPAGVGTFLVSLGISSGVTELMSVIRVDTPAAPSWNWQSLSLGDISSGTVPSATQLGSARTIATVAQRAMNAVWRNNNLYACNTIKPTVGVDSPQATAHWYRINTLALPALVVADQGNVGGEDIGAGMHTMMPAVHVDKCDNMAIGFSASGPTIYASAYYATRLAGDPAGTIGASALLAAGTDYYIRTFSSSLTAASRWGDYSGLSLCPTDESTFWVYNEYACTRGTPTTVGGVTEDGRWCTRIGSFKECMPISVAFTSFDASAKDGVVALRGSFRSDLGVNGVNVYRGGENGAMQMIASTFASGESFEFTDKSVVPGATYRYQLGVTDGDGEFFSQTLKVSVNRLTAMVEQNNPNPFNPATTISFTVAEQGHVVLSVFDVSGKLVRTLVDGVSPVGSHEVTWDGRDDNGGSVGSGVYFYRFTAGKYNETKKMVMLK